MNYKKIGLILLMLVCTTTKSFAQNSLETKIKLQQPYSTSNQEKNYKFYNSAENPNSSLINGSIGSMSNMLNGINNNIYNAQELQKQQAEYVKQQNNYEND